MKKYLLVPATWFCSMVLPAQTPDYPPAPPAGTITAIEYFIDGNPNFGTATLLTGIIPATDITGFAGTINLTGVLPGFHRIYIRSKDAAGTWSHTNHAYFDNYNAPLYASAPPAVVNIVQAEYTIDNEPGLGNGTPIVLTPGIDLTAASVNINVTGLPQGVHRLYIRTKDINGIWSLTHTGVFDNINVPAYPAALPAPVNIVQAEYFIDNEPGLGNGTPLTLTAGADIAALNTSVNITGFNPGVHRLYVRSKDANNRWSLNNLSVFDNSSAAAYPTAPVPAPAMGNMEYFIDTDPGIGMATAITVPGNTGDVSNYAVNITLSGNLTVGTHNLYIRSRQNPWSLTTVIPFAAANPLPLTWSYVKAQLQNNDAVISWGTLQESNTKEFTVEHSADGITFTALATQAAAGNSATAKQYTFTHTNIAPGMHYYRIRQSDLDDRFTYSPVVSLVYKVGLLHTIAAPNPAINYTMLLFGKATKKTTARIITADGKVVKVIAIPDGQWQQPIDVSSLPKGKYFILVMNNETKETIKLVKQ